MKFNSKWKKYTDIVMSLVKTGIFSKVIEKKDELELGLTPCQPIVQEASNNTLKVNEFESFFKNFSPIIKDKRKIRKDKDILSQTKNNIMALPSFLSQKEITSSSLFDSKSPSLQRSLSEVEPRSELRPQRMFKPSLNRSFVEEERHKIQLEGTPMQIKVYRPEGCVSHIFSSKVSKEQQESSPERLKIGLHSRNSEVKIEVRLRANFN